jgi:HlyD family secretion protein
MELGDPHDLEMKIDVLSTEAVRIRPGAQVYVDHWGSDKILGGAVRVVEPSAFLKISALGVEEKRVNVIADFVEPCDECHKLGDGFRIEARIVIDQAENVLKVPTGVLFREHSSWHVYRIVDGVAKQQSVTIGLSNDLEAEIIEGLSEGDQLILYPTDEINDGVLVQPSR